MLPPRGRGFSIYIPLVKRQEHEILWAECVKE
jgi:hypothetical protein